MLEKLIKKCKNKLPECKKRKELSINAMDKDGHTPIDYAYRFNSSKEKDKKKIIEVLEEAGGYLNNYFTYDENGKLKIKDIKTGKYIAYDKNGKLTANNRSLIKQKTPATAGKKRRKRKHSKEKKG